MKIAQHTETNFGQKMKALMYISLCHFYQCTETSVFSVYQGTGPSFNQIYPITHKHKDGDRSQGKLSSLPSGGKWPPTCFYILRFFSRGIDKAMPVLQLLFYVKRIRSRSLQSGSTVYKWQKYQSGRPFSQKKQR